MVSFDVTSLFTNVPLNVVIELLTFEWHLIASVCDIEQHIFMTVIKFIFDSAYFVYGGTSYKQVFGTPMGSPLSPILADIVMDHLLVSVLPLLPEQPGFIHKYVDDLVLTLPDDRIDTTLEIFNGFNEHIQFTMEREVNGQLPFLDVLLLRGVDNRIHTDWYQKPTNSGRYINFKSNHPINHKINTVMAMKSRVLRLSHDTFHGKNLDKLFKIFSNNGYPKTILKKLLYRDGKQRPAVTDMTAPPNTTVTVYKRLPFVPGLSRSLSNTFKIDGIKIAYYNLTTEGSFFFEIKGQYSFT